VILKVMDGLQDYRIAGRNKESFARNNAFPSAILPSCNSAIHRVVWRDPGLITGMPSAHNGQTAASKVGSAYSSSA